MFLEIMTLNLINFILCLSGFPRTSWTTRAIRMEGSQSKWFDDHKISTMVKSRECHLHYRDASFSSMFTNLTMDVIWSDLDPEIKITVNTEIVPLFYEDHCSSKLLMTDITIVRSNLSLSFITRLESSCHSKNGPITSKPYTSWSSAHNCLYASCL